MTKNQELLELKSLSAKLGPDSYIGPWLASIIPEIECDVRSDLQPMITWFEARKQAAQAINDARKEYERIIQEAQQHASRITKTAQNASHEAINNALNALASARSSLERWNV
jgi:multidrug resistance efflux pump